MQKQTVEWQAPQFCPWGLKIPHNIQQTTTHFLPPVFPYCCWCCCCINIVNSNNYRRQKQQQQGFDILFLVGGWEIQPPLQLPLPPGSNAPVSCRIPILSSRFFVANNFVLISAKNLLTQLSRAVFSGSFLLVSPFVSCQKEVFPIVFQHMLAGHGGFLVSCHFFFFTPNPSF